MKKSIKLAASILVMASLGACQTVNGMGNKQMGGAVVGAGLGGLAGAQIGSGKGQLAAVAIGALLGGLMGSEAGKSLDRMDQNYVNQSAQNSLENNPSGRPAVWRNPDTGHSGSVTPTKTYVSKGGADCREYVADIYIEGRMEKAKGVACRQPNGKWKVKDVQSASADPDPGAPGNSTAKESPPVYTQTPSGQWRSSDDSEKGEGDYASGTGRSSGPGGDIRTPNDDWRDPDNSQWQAPDVGESTSGGAFTLTNAEADDSNWNPAPDWNPNDFATSNGQQR